jgi:hypothetical protein
MAVGRQHEVKFLMKIWKQIEFLNMEEDSVREHNQYIKSKTRRMLSDHSRSGCMRKLERGTLELWSSFNGKRLLTRNDLIGKV